ncbi:MAG: ADP compounds hydrolase NudE [Gammaproteobacteria bacterium]|nr:ADP compounds hydrolase NudE [Gammaproteobacteria bacterium]
MPKKPKILSTKTIARTKIFTIERMHLRFENGCEVEYERIVSPPGGAVLIVPQLNDTTVLLIREYCGGIQRYEIAFPKGRIENNESITESANREIMEEIGYAANHIEPIKTVTVSPGYNNHQTHIVFATDLYEHRLDGDEPEPIEVIPWDINKLNDLLQNKEFTEARSIAALFLLKDRFFKTGVMQ